MQRGLFKVMKSGSEGAFSSWFFVGNGLLVKMSRGSGELEELLQGASVLDCIHRTI